MKSNKKKKTSKKLPFRREESGLPLAWVGAMLDLIGSGSKMVSSGQDALGHTNEYGYRTDSSTMLGGENMLNPVGKSGSILKSDMSGRDKLKGIGGAWLGVVPGLAGVSGNVTERLNDKYSSLSAEDEKIRQGLDTMLNTQHVDRNIPTFALGGDIGDPPTPIIPNSYFSGFGIDTTRLSTNDKERFDTMKGIVQFQKRDFTDIERQYGLEYFKNVDKKDSIRREQELQDAMDLVKDNKLPELALGGPIRSQVALLNKQASNRGITEEEQIMIDNNTRPEDNPYSYLFEEMVGDREPQLEYAGGGEIPNGIDKIIGNNHEQGGVNIGGRVEGEGGETKDANYIYSDRFKIDKEDIKRFDLPKHYAGKTLANITEKISKKYELRENDPLDNRDKRAEMDVIKGIQKQKQAIELLERMKKLAKTNPEALAQMQQQGMGQPRRDGSGQGMGIGQQLAQTNGGAGIPKAAYGMDISPIDKPNPYGTYDMSKLTAQDKTNLNSFNKSELSAYNDSFDWNNVDSIKGLQQHLIDNGVTIPGGADNKGQWFTLDAMKNNQGLVNDYLVSTNYNGNDSTTGDEVYDNYADEKEDATGAGLLTRPEDKNWFSDYLNGLNNNKEKSSLPLYADGLSHSSAGDNSITPDSISANDGESSNIEDKFHSSGATLANVFDIARGVIGSFAPKKQPNLIGAPQVNAAYLDPTRALQSATTSELTTESNIANSGIGAGSILASRLALASNAAKTKATINAQYDAQNSAIFNKANMFNAQMQMTKAQTNQGELRYNEQINQQEKDVALNTIQTGLQNVAENRQMQQYMSNQKENQDMLLGTIGGDYVKLVRDGNTLSIVPTNTSNTDTGDTRDEAGIVKYLKSLGRTDEEIKTMMDEYRASYGG